MGDEAVTDLCARFWQWRMAASPEFATFSGCHKHDDRLDDFSLDGFKKRGEAAKKFLEEAEKIDQSKPNAANQLNVEMLKDDLKSYIGGLKHEGFLCPINYMEGLHVDCELVISWMKFKELKDYEKYINRLKAIPQRLQDVEDLMKRGVELGKTVSQYAMIGVVDILKKRGSTKPEESVFYGPFKELPACISEEQISPLRTQALSVIEKEVAPAYAKLGNYIEQEYMKHLRPNIAASSISDGEAYYQACLDQHLSIHMTPQEVHDIGKKEVTRIRALMEGVIKKVGFEGDFKSFLQHLKTDKQFYFEDKEDIMNAYRDVCYKQIRPSLPKLFHKIPQSQMILEKVSPDRVNSPAAYYLAGTLDGSRPGKFYVNVNNPKACPTYQMMTLSLHEGEPGHHFQCMYAIENQECPAFRQYIEDMNYFCTPSRFPLHTAYVEGWGLYCEYLGVELGLYEDSYSLFGYYSNEIWRALRLVVDTGMHALGWTRQQALDVFFENCAGSEHDLTNEINRYITMPAQACGYKIGELKIKELREKARVALGDKFDVRDFHEEVLKVGPCSLTVLEQIIQAYIDHAAT